MNYTTEQIANLGIALADALQRCETERVLADMYRTQTHELREQNNALYDQVAQLQAELNAIKSCL